MTENTIHSDSTKPSVVTLAKYQILPAISVFIAIFLMLTGFLKVLSPSEVINTSVNFLQDLVILFMLS
jgi:hypothetical protein